MVEYIEKNVAIARLTALEIGNPCATMTDAKRQIADTRPANVAPVVHGLWEWFEDWYPSTPDHPMECEDCGWRCGECKTALEDMVGGCWDDSDDEPKLNYCLNCGAKMDGGDSDAAD